MNIVTDVSEGAWLSAASPVQGSLTIARGDFESYVRILHPLPVESGASDPGTRRLRWSDVAVRNDRIMHPLVQWGRLVGRSNPEETQTSHVGWFDPAELASLVAHLQTETLERESIYAAFWVGGSGQELPQSNVLRVEGLDYVVARSTLDELSDPDWGYSVELGWTEWWRSNSMQLLWPASRAWALESGIDFDSTVVGGSARLINSILADSRYEAYPVPAGADLSWEGDTQNA